MYEYHCKITKIHDGDSGYVEIDLGFYVKVTVPFRLRGINAPELKGATLEAGKAARDYLISQVEEKDVVIKTYKTEKYGRFLSVLFVDGVDINAEMVKNGFAVPFMVEADKLTPLKKA